jgi:hypothetical protein
MKIGGQCHTFAALPKGKRAGTPCIGGWVGPRVSLDGRRRSHIHQDSIPDRLACSEYSDVHWLMVLFFQKGINADRAEVLTALVMKFRSTVLHYVDFQQLPTFSRSMLPPFSEFGSPRNVVMPEIMYQSTRCYVPENLSL